MDFWAVMVIAIAIEVVRELQRIAAVTGLHPAGLWGNGNRVIGTVCLGLDQKPLKPVQDYLMT